MSRRTRTIVGLLGGAFALACVAVSLWLGR
jgi:ABC-type transporter Mla subunit MlaD